MISRRFTVLVVSVKQLSLMPFPDVSFVEVEEVKVKSDRLYTLAAGYLNTSFCPIEDSFSLVVTGLLDVSGSCVSIVDIS